MSSNQTNNKRIAKNTIYLYLRMLLSMVVSLYTSRVVLDVLGVSDYGVYGVVGGVVGMFSFLNSTMAGATSRFLTFELGKGNKERLKATFSSALIIHIGIALIVFVLAETIGMWFLCNKLVIPEGRMVAAHWVFQLSILGMAVTVTQVPYNSTIIAHEKMDVYAYVELLHVFLKLGIVYLLLIGHFDKLILYVILMLAVNFIIAFTYCLYCIKHYDESCCRPKFDKEISKGLLSFSIYNLLGNMGSVINLQGTAFVINIFFGVLYNAAASIGTTISNVVTGFATNIMVAFRPPITKCYAQDDIPQFQSLILWAIKAILLVYAFIALPVGFAIQELLSLWLVEVPIYADTFCQLLLLSIFFETLRYIINMGTHATGDVKLISLITGITYSINPILVFILYKLGLPPAYAYVSIIGINLLLSFINMLILKYNEPRISLRLLVFTSAHVVIVVLIVMMALYWASMHKTGHAFLDILYIGSISSILMLLCGFYGVLDKSQRQRVTSFVKNKIKK